MKIEKLQMCRLCLVEDVRMFNVTNKDLQTLYEKLTDVPFVTEDSRPMLACVFCFTRLKQCCQLQRKCLEAEKMLTEMFNMDFEIQPPINKDPLEYFSGYIISPTVHVNCVLDECQSESNDIKEELPDDCEEHNDINEIKEEHQTERVCLDSCTDVEDIPDSDDDMPLIKLKAKETDVCNKEKRDEETQSGSKLQKDDLIHTNSSSKLLISSGESKRAAAFFKGCTRIQTQDEVKARTPINIVREIEQSDVELEEPFSPVVSEYVPRTDSSNSDNDLQFNKGLKEQKTRKNKNKSYHCKSSPSTSKKTKLDEVSANSLRDNSLATPRSSRVKRKITTPDSFKEILKAVQRLDCIVPTPSNELTCSATHRKKNWDKIHRSSDNVFFVASTSIVYNGHGEQSSSQHSPSDMDTTTSFITETAHSYEDHSAPSPLMEEQPTNIDFVALESTVYLNDKRFTENMEPTSRKRKARKRVKDESSWQNNKNKILKNSGKRYHSKAAKKEIPGKVLGDPCACKNKCSEKIDDSERKLAFETYWALGNHERQWDYILKYVKGKPTRKAVVNSKRPRTQTLVYSLPKSEGRDSVTVCKKMFVQTLNIHDKTVYTAIDKQENLSIVDRRGRHAIRPNKISEATTKSVVDHINMFPRKKSHYLRKQTQREYLDENLNCAKMHRLYLDWIKNNPDYENVTPASARWYYHVFNTQFNIGFFHPKKDLCETCNLYEQADSERRQQLKEDYESHVRDKELVRNIKQQEKETSDEKVKTVACFDLEKVLYLPQSEVGVFHYKRKYPVYNFTVCNILTKSGYCFLWHAQIARRGANEIASCLWHFLKSESDRGIKEISFYSDNCTGQNRNCFIFALYLYASKTLNIKITHRFLQKGHSQNEGDTMHSCIEKIKKKHVLYVPEEVYAVVRNAEVQGQKYNVKEMSQDDFFDFKKLLTPTANWDKDVSGNSVHWTKIIQVSAEPYSPGKLEVKYDFEDTPVIVDTNRSGKVVRRNEIVETENTESSALMRLYDAPLPISENLHRDLMSLCNANHIPSHYQTFYKNLRVICARIESGSEIEDDVD